MAEERAERSNGVVGGISATYRTRLRESEALISTEGMTMAQFHALSCVAERGPRPKKEISEKMDVTKANITGLVDKLESKGLVMRTAHRHDPRATIIQLTPKGRAAQERVDSKYLAFMAESLKVLTKSEQIDLRNVLLKLQDGMSQAGG